MALGSIGRLLKARLEKGAQIVLLAQQKSSTDRLNWIKAAKHLAAQGVEVKIVWPGSCDDINHLLTTNGPNAVMAAIEAAERVTLDDDQDLVEMNAKYAVVSISGRT